jgi:DNA-binding transcriptional MerR regulator
MPFNSKQTSKLTGATRRQLYYWEQKGLISPTFEVPLKPGTSRKYSPLDLIQIKVITELRQRGISLQKISRSLDYIKKHIHAKRRPLAELKFITNGRSVFIHAKERIIDTAEEGQYVLSLHLGDMVEKLNQDIKELMQKKWVSLDVDGEEFRVLVDPQLDSGTIKAHWQGVKDIEAEGETEEDALRTLTAAIRRFKKGW